MTVEQMLQARITAHDVAEMMGTTLNDISEGSDRQADRFFAVWAAMAASLVEACEAAVRDQQPETGPAYRAGSGERHGDWYDQDGRFLHPQQKDQKK